MRTPFTRISLSALAAATLAMSFAACGDGEDPEGKDEQVDTGIHREGENPYNLARCPEVENETILQYDQGFQTTEARANMSQKINKSFGHDTMITPGKTQQITGRFFSADINVPIEGLATFTAPADEPVVIFTQNADGKWKKIAETKTDTDGKYLAELSGDDAFDVGSHRVLSILKADGTCVDHGVYVYPEGQPVIVTDIDATLTTHDEEFLKQLGDLDRDPAMLDGADDMATAWANKGYIMLYLSARPIDTASMTRTWLRQHEFPLGPIGGANSFVHGNSAATFKSAWVQNVKDDVGWNVIHGYGNAFSDVDGYLDAKIPADKIYMVNEAACFAEPDVGADSTCLSVCTEEKWAETGIGCKCKEDAGDTCIDYSMEADHIAYRGVNAVVPNKSYHPHIEDFIEKQPDASEL